MPNLIIYVIKRKDVCDVCNKERNKFIWSSKGILDPDAKLVCLACAYREARDIPEIKRILEKELPSCFGSWGDIKQSCRGCEWLRECMEEWDITQATY